MESSIPAQPAPPHIVEARDAIFAVLIDPDLDTFTMAEIGEVYGRLVEMHPLHMASDPDAPLDVRTGLDRAITALGLATAEVGTPGEIVKLGLIARALQDVLASYGQ